MILVDVFVEKTMFQVDKTIKCVKVAIPKITENLALLTSF